MTEATSRFLDKREAILDAAARQFNRHGAKGATVSEIAASVGLVTNSLTYYYRKKEDLLVACLERSIEAMGMHADAALREPSLQARLRGFVAGYFELLAAVAEGRHPELMVFSDLLSVPPPRGTAVQAAYTELFRRVRRLLDAGDAPRLLAPERNARAHLLLSTMSWSRTWLVRHEPRDHARIARRLADLMLDGLSASGPPVAPAEFEPSWRELGDEGDEPGATRGAYLRAATRLVNEHGYRGASVDRIAAELRLTKGSFYHHHETKEELITACFERTFTVMRAAQDAALQAPGRGLDRLALACRSLLRFQTSTHGPLLRVTAWTGLPDALREDMRRTMARLGERFASLVLDGMSDGSIRVVDPSMAAQVVSGTINAAAELMRWAPGVQEDRAFDLFALPLLTGLRTPPKR